MLRKNLNWENPLEMAYSLSVNSDYKKNWVLLYSGLNNEVGNSYSYLALYPKKEIIADDFKEFEQQLKKKQQKEINNKWFGYLSYNLKNTLEKLPKDRKFFIDLPNLWQINFNLILVFNHKKQQITCYYSAKKFLQQIPSPLKIKLNKSVLEILEIKSNFTKAQYLQKLDYIQEKIKAGDIYQANLTRKFFGSFKNQKDSNKFELFIRLNKYSPANFSAFLKLGKNYIISSSPELFLTIDQRGQAVSSPIKGTMPRFSDPKLDNLSKRNLKNSNKEKGENLMIVDLVRNDLSKSCIVNSVKVKNLFKITSYKTLHHMSSDIYGLKKDQCSALELAKNCFPPGSMTGVPKIKAMEICSKLEKDNRGVYGGVIGFFDCNNQICNLSVVIRTIIIQDNKLEFQVGGAITFDSNPHQEWQETINKARGIAKVFGIKLQDLRKL